jgi:hypothetical protein
MDAMGQGTFYSVFCELDRGLTRKTQNEKEGL